MQLLSFKYYSVFSINHFRLFSNCCSHSFLRKFCSQEIQQEHEISKAYVPKEVESISLPEAFFKPPLKSPEKFRILLPPPNITGTLHLGHALTTAIQDVLVKWKSMKGIETTWIPGLDHAGIATQVVVEKLLWSERKKTRHDLGREAFVEEIWKWQKNKAETIVEQLNKLGVSLDWQHRFFTMDETHSEVVNQSFIKLFEDGLLYEADHLVNWSCTLQSAISDIEVEHLKIDKPTKLEVPGYDRPIIFGKLYKFAYKLSETDDEIVVGTTRPETIFGDVAVAVHPMDGRYTRFVGKFLWHPLRKENIPIIADEFVDPTFSTGAVKITPGHDFNDHAAVQRHSLKVLNIIDESGCLRTSDAFHGMKRFEARTKILEFLREKSLFRGEENHVMSIPICSRSKDVIELMLKPQWFLKTSDMARKAVEDVRERKLVIEPETFEKVWFQWLENNRDWCVSRQLWWGHRIPIYHCSSAEKKFKVAALSEAEALKKAKLQSGENALHISQSNDVLDTWFSSALLPISTQNENLEKLSLMETGHDIIFFWVARMVMLGTYLTGQLPFERILLHGIVCDANGRKMSKSLGNVIAPEDVIHGRSLKDLKEISNANHQSGILSEAELSKAVEGQKKMFPEGIPECGADALRFTLLSHNVKNHFIHFDVQECKTNKLFGNKIWQAVKFAVKWCKLTTGQQDTSNLTEMDRWIASRLVETVDKVNAGLQNSEFYICTAALKDFLYYDFCDIYLECIKSNLKDTDSTEAANHCYVLRKCLDVGLRSLGPFMPHLSQHLHGYLRANTTLEGDNYYPEYLDFTRDIALEKVVEDVLGIATGIRRLKKVFNMTYKDRPEVVLITKQLAAVSLQPFVSIICDLAACDRLTITAASDSELSAPEYVKDEISNNTQIYLRVSREQRARFQADFAKLEERRCKFIKDLEKLNGIMCAERYQFHLKPDVHDGNLKKIALLKEKIARIDSMRYLSHQT